MDDIRIPKQAYKMMILTDESEKKSWVTEVKNVLSKNGFYCVCLQGAGDEEIFAWTETETYRQFYSRMECNYSR